MREFRLLGPIEALVDGYPVPIGYAKQRGVLVLLVLEAGKVVSIERIIDRIWGPESPASVCNVLYGHVARLRRSVDALRRRSGGYVLDVAPDEVDLFQFRSLVSQARLARDDAAGLRLWKEAIEMWRGPALAGVESQWVHRMRRTLEWERVSARLGACDTRMRLGMHEQALSELTELAADDPLHEGVASRLMLALYLRGHTAAALDHFGEVRRGLADELGADPGAELEQLHLRMLRRDESLRA